MVALLNWKHDQIAVEYVGLDLTLASICSEVLIKAGGKYLDSRVTRDGVCVGLLFQYLEIELNHLLMSQMGELNVWSRLFGEQETLTFVVGNFCGLSKLSRSSLVSSMSKALLITLT